MRFDKAGRGAVLAGGVHALCFLITPAPAIAQTNPSAQVDQATTADAVALPDAAVAPAPAISPHEAPVAEKTASSTPKFPAAVAPKYASQKVGAQRRHTCLDQYRVNKASSGNGDLKWVQKGGGYYSACSKRLKAQAGKAA